MQIESLACANGGAFIRYIANGMSIKFAIQMTSKLYFMVSSIKPTLHHDIYLMLHTIIRQSHHLNPL